MNKRGIIGSIVALLILVLCAWAFGWLDRKDPVIAQLEKQRDADFERQDEMTEAEQRASRERFGEQMRGLSEDQRRTFFESSMPIMLKMFERRIDHFLELSPEEQRKEMDKRIDEMKARGQGGPGGGGQGGGGRAGGPREGGPRPSGKEIDEWRKKMLDWTTPEQRAKFDAAFQKFNSRLQERGMNPVSGGGFF